MLHGSGTLISISLCVHAIGFEQAEYYETAAVVICLVLLGLKKRTLTTKEAIGGFIIFRR